MASIGRWTSVDPLAEAYYGISSYVYALNDPISKLDPNGMWVEDKDGFHTDNPEKIGEFFNHLNNNLEDPPVEKSGIDWNQAGKDFVDGIPVVGPALRSGDKLEGGDYSGAAADFGMALADLATLGFGGKLVSFTTSQLSKSAAKTGINQSSRALLKNGYYEVNGFKFSEYYYNKLWSTGRGAPSLVANEVLEGGAKTAVPHATKIGFKKYIYGNWEMVYNPTTKEVWHLQPIK